MTGGGREEVDVAAVVAEELSRHAPGTTVTGPESGGVQVIRVSLDLTAFRALLRAVAGTLGPGSTLRLDAFGGVLLLDVTGSRAGDDAAAAVLDAAAALDGEVLPGDRGGYGVRVPSGLSEWD